MKLLRKLACIIWFTTLSGAVAGALVASLMIFHQHPYLWIALAVAAVVGGFTAIPMHNVVESGFILVILLALGGLSYPVIKKREARGLVPTWADAVMMGFMCGAIPGTVLCGTFRELGDGAERPPDDSA